MSRVIVKSFLLNKSTKEENNLEVNGIRNDNTITYKDKENLVKIKINDDYILMTRENEIQTIEFIFKEKTLTKCICDIYSKRLELNLFTEKIEKLNNGFKIDYTVEESEKITFELLIEEIE